MAAAQVEKENRQKRMQADFRQMAEATKERKARQKQAKIESEKRDVARAKVRT
jgi:hypothetical protein